MNAQMRFIQTCLFTTLMLSVGGCRLGTWGNRFTGQTYNLMGFGETGSEYGTLISKEELMGSLERPLHFADDIINARTGDGKNAVVIRFNLGAVVVIGDSPPTNRFRYNSNNPTIELWLIRNSSEGTDLQPAIATLLASSADARDKLDEVYRLEGSIALTPPTSHNGHFDYVSLNVGTLREVLPNNAWLTSWEKAHPVNDAIMLRAKRWRAVPAKPGPALINGGIAGDYLFRGW